MFQMLNNMGTMQRLTNKNIHTDNMMHIKIMSILHQYTMQIYARFHDARPKHTSFISGIKIYNGTPLIKRTIK